MQTRSFEDRFKKIAEREEKTKSLQESSERFIEKRFEEIKKQDEKRQQNAEKNLPGVT